MSLRSVHFLFSNQLQEVVFIKGIGRAEINKQWREVLERGKGDIIKWRRRRRGGDFRRKWEKGKVKEISCKNAIMQNTSGMNLIKSIFNHMFVLKKILGTRTCLLKSWVFFGSRIKARSPNLTKNHLNLKYNFSTHCCI